MTRKRKTKPIPPPAPPPPPLDLDAIGITFDSPIPIGPRNKYSPDTLQRIYSALAQGAIRQHAAHQAGISEATFSVWLTEQQGFAALVQKGEAHYIDSRLTVLRKHGDTQWLPVAWELERRFPQMFGRLDRAVLDVRHSGSVGELAEKPPADIVAQLAHLVRRVKGRGAPALPEAEDAVDIEPDDDPER